LSTGGFVKQVFLNKYSDVL